MLFPLGVLAPFAYYFPKIALFYALCGAYDVGRNGGLKLSTLRRYFIGNGFLTWVLSPFNTLLDLLSLPHINKGVYRLEDLPPAYQDEVKRLLRIAKEENLVIRLEERAKEFPRTMVLFRWYGANVDTLLDIPAFHQPWKYIQTIGVSVFNKKVSTSWHFEFMRASLRILYNLNDMTDHSAYITVGGKTSYWRENKLFIFDDTLLHYSANEPTTLLPVRRHGSPDAVPGRYAPCHVRHPAADLELQVRLLPKLEGPRPVVKHEKARSLSQYIRRG